MPRRGQRSLSPSRSIREVRQRMSAGADSSPINVTNLRDVIDVPVPVIDVGDSSLRVPSLLSDEPTLEFSGILCTNSVMIPVAPVALPMPENVSVSTVYQRQVH